MWDVIIGCHGNGFSSTCDACENCFLTRVIWVFADGPAEDLYGIFINRVRRERPPEFLEKIRG